MENCVKCPIYEWPNQEKNVCIEKKTEFLSYKDDSLTLVFIVLSIMFILIVAVILGIFISFRDTPVVKANNRNLSFVLLFSIKLSFLSVFLFLGRPSDITCMLRQTSFGITFSIAMSSVLAKTVMVCIAFKASKPGSTWRKWIGVKLAYCIVIICSFIQFLITGIWLTISSPFVEYNLQSEPGKIIIQCNEGSVIAFYIVLSYMGLLASVSFIVAFLARTLPDSFNEANPIVIHYVEIISLLFAIDKINKNPDLLPNITLGYHVYDSCMDPSHAIGSVLQILSGPGEIVPNYLCKTQGKIAGFIGDWSTITTLPIAQLLGTYGYSQISYGSTEPVLNDRTQYPYYFSTGLNDHIQHIAIAELVERLGWTWVIILAPGDDRGERESEDLKKEITNHGACVDFIGTLREDESTNIRTLERIHNSIANVVVLCGGLFRSQALSSFVEVWISDKTLVIPETWVHMYSPWLFNGSLRFVQNSLDETKEFYEYFLAVEEHPLRQDLFLFSLHCLTQDAEKDALFQQVYGNVFSNCSASASQIEQVNVSSRVYRAVNGLAHAEHKLLSSSGKHLNNEIHNNIHRTQLHRYLRNVNFREPWGTEIDFNELDQSPVKYEIFTWHFYFNIYIEHISEKVGEYFWSKSERSLELNISEILWKKNTDNQTLKSQCSSKCSPGYRKVPRKGAPPCCYNCIRCSEGEISNQTDMENCLKCPIYEWPNNEKTMCIEKKTEFLSYEDDSLTLVFIVLSIMFILIVAVILGIFISFRDTPVVKANNRNVSFILLFSIKLSFLSVFLFLGRPSDITCMLRQTSFGISFSIAMSSVLAKTVMVCIAFKASKPGSTWRKWLGVKLAYCIVIICSFIQFLITGIWLNISPPFMEHNIQSELGKIIIQCNEGSVIAFYIVLSYMGLLASVSFIVAFLAQTLPDSFNEAKYITFSMLLFCSVWITMIPAYLSTKGKYMVAVEIFAIISSSCGLLFCIFLPKCYIIIFRPKMNTKQYLLGNNKQ
ncbi:hypothetical protein XELAEV_18003434mg [Xenopus laevis]|nr:hypothetical protein XELAEV_18003434mg [Xenopus laevis]